MQQLKKLEDESSQGILRPLLHSTDWDAFKNSLPTSSVNRDLNTLTSEFDKTRLPVYTDRDKIAFMNLLSTVGKSYTAGADDDTKKQAIGGKLSHLIQAIRMKGEVGEHNVFL